VRAIPKLALHRRDEDPKKTPEKVLSHIPGPVAKPAREKWIAWGTAGSTQPGYEVTGMQSTISGSPRRNPAPTGTRKGPPHTLLHQSY